MKEVVTFFLSGKEYGADVSEIQGIENYVEYAKEPGLSDGFFQCYRREPHMNSINNVWHRKINIWQMYRSYWVYLQS